MFSAALKFVTPRAIRQIPNKKIDPIYSEAPREKFFVYSQVRLMEWTSVEIVSLRPPGITSLSAELGLMVSAFS